MILTFTRDELLSRWRLVRHCDAGSPGISVIIDGHSVPSCVETDFEAWWYRILDTAPLSWLCPCDMLGHATVTISEDGTAAILESDIPLHRIGELRLEGWTNSATIVENDSHRARLQLNDYSRAGILEPVAVKVTATRYHLYPATSTRLQSLTAVDDSVYSFDSRLLATMNYESL